MNYHNRGFLPISLKATLSVICYHELSGLEQFHQQEVSRAIDTSLPMPHLLEQRQELLYLKLT